MRLFEHCDLRAASRAACTAGNNSATDNNTVVTPTADLSITKTDGLTSIAQGGTVRVVIGAELSAGQMVEDVELAVRGAVPVLRFCWLGGVVPSEREIEERVLRERGSW